MNFSDIAHIEAIAKAARSGHAEPFKSSPFQGCWALAAWHGFSRGALMSIQICRELVDLDFSSDGQLIRTIKSKGGFAYQGWVLEMQGFPKLKLYKVQDRRITGTALDYLARRRDWRRKAIARVQTMNA